VLLSTLRNTPLPLSHICSCLLLLVVVPLCLFPILRRAKLVVATVSRRARFFLYLTVVTSSHYIFGITNCHRSIKLLAECIRC
jgi:hypothetical protein